MFQRRGDFENPPDFFNRSLEEYENGFGDERGEFWLGLGTMRMLTRYDNILSGTQGYFVFKSVL